jgi:hypothetical protein
MTDRDELRAAAERVHATGGRQTNVFACNPEKILELLDTLDSAEQERNKLQQALDEIIQNGVTHEGGPDCYCSDWKPNQRCALCVARAARRSK